MKKIYVNPEKGVPGVLVATRDDEEDLYPLLMLIHAENAWFSMNPTKVRAGMEYATRGQGGIIYIIREGKRIIASLGLLIVSDWYSDDEYLLERWNYVHPDFRKTDCARKLIEHAKWTSDWFTRKALADGHPPMPVIIGVTSLNRTEGKVRLYSRHMACIGATFMYGQLPKHNKMMIEAMRRLKEFNLLAHKERSTKAIPVVETILRVGQSEEEYGHRQQR